jgi:hypothetical protein
MRTIAGRRASHLVRTYLAELGADPTEQDKRRIDRLVRLDLYIERTDGGAAVSADELMRLASEHRRLLTELRSRAVRAKPAGHHDPLAAPAQFTAIEISSGRIVRMRRSLMAGDRTGGLVKSILLRAIRYRQTIERYGCTSAPSASPYSCSGWSQSHYPINS